MHPKQTHQKSPSPFNLNILRVLLWLICPILTEESEDSLEAQGIYTVSGHTGEAQVTGLPNNLELDGCESWTIKKAER